MQGAQHVDTATCLACLYAITARTAHVHVIQPIAVWTCICSPLPFSIPLIHPPTHPSVFNSASLYFSSLGPLAAREDAHPGQCQGAQGRLCGRPHGHSQQGRDERRGPRLVQAQLLPARRCNRQPQLLQGTRQVLAVCLLILITRGEAMLSSISAASAPLSRFLAVLCVFSHVYCCRMSLCTLLPS